MLTKLLSFKLTPEKLQSWFAAIGGRRFWLTMCTGAGNWILVYNAKITGEIYRDVTLATVAAFIGGVTFQKHSQAKSASQVAQVQAATSGPTDSTTNVEVKVDAGSQ
jgi:hypothetical protein